MKALKFRKENIFWSIFIFDLSVVLMLSSFHLHSSRFNSWRSCSLFSPFGWVYSTSIPLPSSHSEFWFRPFHFPSRFFFFICSLFHNLICTLDFPMTENSPCFLCKLNSHQSTQLQPTPNAANRLKYHYLINSRLVQKYNYIYIKLLSAFLKINKYSSNYIERKNHIWPKSASVVT